MTALTGTFTATGASPYVVNASHGDASFAVTGTFVGTFVIEKAFGPESGWLKHLGPFTGPVSDLIATHQGEVFRFRCTSFTSGTINYSITPTVVRATGGSALPTSSAGLPSGALWNNAGVVCVA